jgi:hypothetical protein
MARRFPMTDVMRILMLVGALVAIILAKDACGQAVKNLFNTVAPPVVVVPDAGADQMRR